MHDIEQHLKAGTPRACPWVSQIADSGTLSGRYERELINMLEAAFANAEVEVVKDE